MDYEHCEAANPAPLPEIDCVIVGHDCSDQLCGCLASVRTSDYPQRKLHIHYIDLGSTDDSREIAGSCWGVRVTALGTPRTTPGAAKNAGWTQGSAPFIQFIDAFSILDPKWLKTGVHELTADHDLGAVFGLSRKLHPVASFYNRMEEIERRPPEGASGLYGCDALIRREALESTGGYDYRLIAGQEQLLGRDILRAGWKILRLETIMVLRDLAAVDLWHCLCRAYLAGYEIAAVRHGESRAGSPYLKDEFRILAVTGVGVVASILLSLLLFVMAPSEKMAVLALVPAAIGLCLLFSPRFFMVEKFMHDRKVDRALAKTYAWQRSLVLLPQLFGLLGYHSGWVARRPNEQATRQKQMQPR
ncbi:MAG: glycosyltransferase [Chlorobiaceae bacterium]|nr:glycosyltransferase [Chlorobiaceae bacterium]NTW74011.1 glycosyltransferase [Chlorobiaceae bacterium]